jgi:UDPglucose 6-dehydrogenase
VVTNSTVPIGIGDDVERIIRETNKADIVVASNPQFQREEPAIRDSSCPTASSSAPPTSAAAR